MRVCLSILVRACCFQCFSLSVPDSPAKVLGFLLRGAVPSVSRTLLSTGGRGVGGCL